MNMEKGEDASSGVRRSSKCIMLLDLSIFEISSKEMYSLTVSLTCVPYSSHKRPRSAG